MPDVTEVPAKYQWRSNGKVQKLFRSCNVLQEMCLETKAS